MEGFVKAGRRRGAQLYLTKICLSNSTQAVLEVLEVLGGSVAQ